MMTLKIYCCATLLFFNQASDCIASLPKGTSFLKEYRINTVNEKKEKVEYSYVFSKRTTYVLKLCGQSSGMRITIYNYSRDTVFEGVLSDQNQVSLISYACAATGIYYIRFYLEGRPYAVNAILGFSYNSN